MDPIPYPTLLALVSAAAATGFAVAWWRQRDRTREAEERLAERAREASDLGEAASRHRTLIDAIPEFISFKDSETRHLTINAACANFLGVDPEEAQGKTNADLLPPEMFAAWHADDLSVLESGRRLALHLDLLKPLVVHTRGKVGDRRSRERTHDADGRQFVGVQFVGFAGHDYWFL